MKEKVIVTGGMGFIGSHLVKELLKKYDVKIFDNLSTNKVDEMEMLPYGELITGDILNYELLKEVFKNVKYVFHLAALASVPNSFKDPITTRTVNIIGTINVLNAAKNNNVKKVVFASSSSIYEHKSPYAHTKCAGESYCKYIYPNSSASLRLFNVYGEGQEDNVIYYFLNKMRENKPIEIYGDGKTVRDFIHVDDVVRAFIHFAENETTGSYDIGTGKGTTLDELAKMFSDFSIYKPERQGDSKYSIANIELAKKQGFEAKVLLEKGIECLVGEK